VRPFFEGNERELAGIAGNDDPRGFRAYAGRHRQAKSLSAGEPETASGLESAEPATRQQVFTRKPMGIIRRQKNRDGGDISNLPDSTQRGLGN
jgi:hypothetical protein